MFLQETQYHSDCLIRALLFAIELLCFIYKTNLIWSKHCSECTDYIPLLSDCSPSALTMRLGPCLDAKIRG